MIVTVAKVTVLASYWGKATLGTENERQSSRQWGIANYNQKRAKEIMKSSDNQIGYGGSPIYYTANKRIDI